MVVKLAGGARLGVASGTSGDGAVGGGAAALRSAGGEQAASRAMRGRQRELDRMDGFFGSRETVKRRI
jgi:hypothetical protein